VAAVAAQPQAVEGNLEVQVLQPVQGVLHDADTLASDHEGSVVFSQNQTRELRRGFPVHQAALGADSGMRIAGSDRLVDVHILHPLLLLRVRLAATETSTETTGVHTQLSLDVLLAEIRLVSVLEQMPVVALVERGKLPLVRKAQRPPLGALGRTEHALQLRRLELHPVADDDVGIIHGALELQVPLSWRIARGVGVDVVKVRLDVLAQQLPLERLVAPDAGFE